MIAPEVVPPGPPELPRAEAVPGDAAPPVHPAASHGATRVLVVEDEASYRCALASGLGNAGFAVELATNGPQALRMFAVSPPDIVLLDMLLPGMHGTEVCRRMRTIAPVPVMVVSAVGTELDVVLSLELGAAGYVTKPFRLRELVARIHAVVRRTSPAPGPLPPPRPDRISDGPVAFGAVTVDFARRDVTIDGEHVHLSRREFDLLGALLSPAGRARTRDELIDLLWPGQDLADTRTIDTHIHRLRTKLEPEPGAPRFIVTIRGVGFRLDPDGIPSI